MQLNYFGCLRVTMGLLPGMVAKRKGPRGQHQLHRRADQCAALLGLRGLQGGAGRLDALRLQRVRRPGHHLHHHQHAAGAHADDRAHQDLQQRADAVLERPKSVATTLGTAASVSYALWPKLNDYVLSWGFRLFPSSSAARQGRKEGHKPTLEQMVFANVFKGEHW
jgi:hypothetical protein